MPVQFAAPVQTFAPQLHPPTLPGPAALVPVPQPIPAQPQQPTQLQPVPQFGLMQPQLVQAPPQLTIVAPRLTQYSVTPMDYVRPTPTKKGLFVLAGPSGGGKSYAARKAFQRAYVFSNKLTNGQFYEQWLLSPAGRASGLGLPRRVMTLDTTFLHDSWVQGPPQMAFGPNGALPVPQLATMMRELTMVVNQTLWEYFNGRPLTYENLIIDEGGTFWQKVWEEVSPHIRNKDNTKADPGKAYAWGETWSRSFLDHIRQLTMCINVCFITHDREPDMDRDKQGGPKFFSAAVQKQICNDADGVLLRRLIDAEPDAPAMDPTAAVADPGAMLRAMAEAKKKPAQRVWQCYASQHWTSKLYGLDSNEFERVKTMELEDILMLAGYAPNIMRAA